MPSVDWHAFLTAWNGELLANAAIRDGLPDEVAGTGWLGYAGADEHALVDLEAYLKRRLPPSYRAFLAASNGWRCSGSRLHVLWSSREVEWFTVRNQDWVDDYITGARAYDRKAGKAGDPDTELLVNALEISSTEDAMVYLLNPLVCTDEGEWEACILANWLPGFSRFPSFFDIMVALRAGRIDYAG